MPAVPEPDRWQRVQDALEAYYLAQDGSDTVDLGAICGGDVALRADVERLLRSPPAAMFGSGGAPEGLPATRRFGDFELLRPIGRGGMGRVYLAVQRSLSRQVAIKMLDQAHTDLPAARLRLRREAELTALLDHPNIVPIHAVGEVDGVPFLAMKFLPGPSLAELGQPVPPHRVAQWGAALARALEAAHVLGIVHRDVKPANVLLDGDVPVFVDFGLARSQADPTLTQPGKIAGTLRYMAPERFDGRSHVLDPRVDVYGLGATLYELLGARPPFDDDNPTALVRSVLTRDPTPLRLRGRDHDLETIVLRAMAKEPERRFANAAAMAEDLERYLAQQPVVSRRLSPLVRLQRRARRHPRTTAAGVFAAAALLLATLALLWQQQRAQADRDARLQRADAELAAHRPERALADLALLAANRPGDADVAAAHTRARAAIALDELFVVLTDRSPNVPARLVADLARALPLAHRSPATAAVGFCAHVLATRHTRGRATARDELATLPDPLRGRRCAQALAAWLDDAPPPWALPPAPADQSPDEVVFTAAVLRLAAAPPEDALAELATATEPGGARTRLRFLEAILRAEAGDPLAALAMLRTMAAPDSPAVMWRWLANLHLQLGQLGPGAIALQRATADPSPAARYLRLAYAADTTGDGATPTPGTAPPAWLAAARTERDPPPEIARFLAEHEALADAAAIPAAVARLEALLAAQADDRIGRELTLATALQLAAAELPTRTDPGPNGPDPAAHRAFLATWEARGLALRHRPARALALPWLARSLCHSDGPADLERGLALFATVCRETPLRATAAILFAETLGDLPTATAARAAAHRHDARRCLAAVEAALERGLVVSAAQRRFLDYYAFLLAVQGGDAGDVAARLPGVADICDERVLQQARQLLAAAAENKPPRER